MRWFSYGRMGFSVATAAWLLSLGAVDLFPAQTLPQEAEGSSLAALVEEIERNEKEMEQVRAALSAPGKALTAVERGRLEKRIEELEVWQARLIQDLERVAGPLPPTVRQETPAPAEGQLESRRLRDDAILEKDVERRLP